MRSIRSILSNILAVQDLTLSSKREKIYSFNMKAILAILALCFVAVFVRNNAHF